MTRKIRPAVKPCRQGDTWEIDVLPRGLWTLSVHSKPPYAGVNPEYYEQTVNVGVARLPAQQTLDLGVNLTQLFGSTHGNEALLVWFESVPGADALLHMIGLNRTTQQIRRKQISSSNLSEPVHTLATTNGWLVGSGSKLFALDRNLKVQNRRELPQPLNALSNAGQARFVVFRAENGSTKLQWVDSTGKKKSEVDLPTTEPVWETWATPVPGSIALLALVGDNGTTTLVAVTATTATVGATLQGMATGILWLGDHARLLGIDAPPFSAMGQPLPPNGKLDPAVVAVVGTMPLAIGQYPDMLWVRAGDLLSSRR